VPISLYEKEKMESIAHGPVTIWLTRMRVLCRRAELTGNAGKIERSADALQAKKA